MLSDTFKENADALAEQLSNFVNHYHRKEEFEYFAKKISNDHRTLQQNTMKLFLAFIEYAASDEYKTDPRNEATKTVAKELIEGFQKFPNHEGSKPSQWLPFI